MNCLSDRDEKKNNFSQDFKSNIAVEKLSSAFLMEGMQPIGMSESKDKLLQEILSTHPIFLKPNKVIGNNVVFRNACVSDAEFILSLRTDPVKGKYLSPTSSDLNSQIAWLEGYQNDNSQIYFIIEDRFENRFGTIRLYDKRDDSFCWGSWILKDNRPSGFAMESALMIYHFAILLGFRGSHFDVRKENESVWRFHERFGAVRTSEADNDYFYSIDLKSILKSISDGAKYLPSGVSVQWKCDSL